MHKSLLKKTVRAKLTLEWTPSSELRVKREKLCACGENESASVASLWRICLPCAAFSTSMDQDEPPAAEIALSAGYLAPTSRKRRRICHSAASNCSNSCGQRSDDSTS